MRAKHTLQNKIRCWKCDFSCAYKAELSTHSDKYYYSHRMCLNSNHKRFILEEFEELKRDDFTVQEDILEMVNNWTD